MLIYHPLTNQLHLYFSDAPRLPDSLEEALVELEKDTAIVDALGEEFIRWYVVRPTQYKLSILKYHEAQWWIQDFLKADAGRGGGLQPFIH